MTAVLKRLPTHDLHVKAKAHLGAFGEWEVPLYVTSILDEHETVRTKAGLFDISHMGEFLLTGRPAKAFLDFLLPRKMERLRDGKALYSPLPNEQGGIVDDLIVYQLHPEKFLIIVNAANIEKDFNWIHHYLPTGVELVNLSDEKSLFALQGPRSLEIVQSLFRCDFGGVGYYHFLILKSDWGEILLSRTGYTGEDGFEIMADMREALSLWQALMETGNSRGLKPIGFGARDTLRLEAGMLLYGQDMDDSTSPVEAGLAWAVDFDKKGFLGHERIFREKVKGPSRKLVGFEMVDRGVPRHGFQIEKNGRILGQVTSGSFAPTLKKNLGLGYVPVEESKVGSEFEVIVRDQKLKVKVVSLPFYTRHGHKL
ncbi:MAG: glycine cleavage system aminomethyltransferase GcvT [Candidatus Omnitrophica bacterium]|nr:glycine cleavage system aminomethyltransferase GcvT [Candidatus Omnitrophota bacterium]